jgi:hypothetical protein
MRAPRASSRFTTAKKRGVKRRASGLLTLIAVGCELSWSFSSAVPKPLAHLYEHMLLFDRETLNPLL